MTGESVKQDIARFEKYAETHGMGGDVSNFEKEFYKDSLNDFRGTILDIGSGDGRYVHFFRELAPNAKIIPMDISHTRMGRIRDGGFLGAVASATELPFQDRKFDRIFLMQVIEHISNYRQTISECARALKHDGICFVTTPNYPIKRFYDWVHAFRNRKWSKIFDDPTHCSPFSADSLRRALRSCFEEVDIFPTFFLGESRFQFIKNWHQPQSKAIFFAHKLLAVCRKPISK